MRVISNQIKKGKYQETLIAAVDAIDDIDAIDLHKCRQWVAFEEQIWTRRGIITTHHHSTVTHSHWHPLYKRLNLFDARSQNDENRHDVYTVYTIIDLE